ncbi:hypothetical protein BKA81DRAFT_371077 [Phyllosticta paracitricarpa]|uniref:Uncharacterized protein n=1 Tax=Phyllosticta citricarpa TaxID=55181 RepID=A0ABR1L7P3_9PEZI
MWTAGVDAILLHSVRFPLLARQSVLCDPVGQSAARPGTARLTVDVRQCALPLYCIPWSSGPSPAVACSTSPIDAGGITEHTRQKLHEPSLLLRPLPLLGVSGLGHVSERADKPRVNHPLTR